MRTALTLAVVCTLECQTLKMFMECIHCILGKSTLSSSTTVSCAYSTCILITYFTKIKFNIIVMVFQVATFQGGYHLKKSYFLAINSNKISWTLWSV